MLEVFRFTPLPPMKKLVLPGTLALVFAGVCELTCAQDLAAPLEPGARAEVGAWQAPSAVDAPGKVQIAPAGLPRRAPEVVFPVQDPATLGMADEFGSVPGGAGGGEAPEGLAGWERRAWPGQMTVALAMMAAGVAAADSAAVETESLDENSDCYSLALRVGQRVKEDRAALLEVVTLEAAANTACACEVVKAALVAAEADPETVAQVVEAVAVAAPETMRMVAQCAIAVSPDSLGRVQAVLARLDPNGASGKAGDSKDAKASLAKAALTPAPDILDLPPPMIPPLIVIPVTDPLGWNANAGILGGR